MNDNNDRAFRKLQMLGTMGSTLRRVSVEAYERVVRSFGISFSTADRTIQTATVEGRVIDRTRGGRPCAINEGLLSVMDQWIEERDGLFTRREMIDELGLPVQERTLSLYINSLGFNSYRRLKAMMLTERHMLTRYDFCAFRVHWNVQKWQRTVFSDECSFKKIHFGINVRVWRRTEDYSRPSAFLGQRQQGEGTLTHVFGVISVFGPGLLLFLDGNLDGEDYMSILSQHVR